MQFGLLGLSSNIADSTEVKHGKLSLGNKEVGRMCWKRDWGRWLFELDTDKSVSDCGRLEDVRASLLF